MALRILAETYVGSGFRNTMSDNNEAKKFKEAVRKALEIILTSPLGIELGREINSADCHLSVLKAPKGRRNEAILARQSPQDLNQACYTEVLDHKLLGAKIQQLLTAKTITRDHPAVKKYMKYYFSPANDPYWVKMETNSPAREKERYPIAHKSQDQARSAAHTTEDTLRDRVKNPRATGTEITEAQGYVNSLQNGLIGYHIMSHLTPGPGTDAFVAWDPEGEDPGAKLPESQRAAWMTRPTLIALVHELIHGWRLVTGQCVFKPEIRIEEYYEEAITVGLPPYDGCKFTENKFRKSSRQPFRTFYAQSTRVISEAAEKKHESVAKRLG